MEFFLIPICTQPSRQVKDHWTPRRWVRGGAIDDFARARPSVVMNPLGIFEATKEHIRQIAFRGERIPGTT